ncbi:hypothetical protein O181_118204 [Austropuccinia psidii MF-1]|uniref:Uncharacterized protein n=1 Tax=Austropuccinia psidii MF-1 TaxID=1389203 RepID=A0A9Q3KC81_9BASI|nr:hypothetical protein [Austropuccinia psidii MF-1]
MPTPHTQNLSSGSVEIPSFDADYIPSELDISALSAHQIKGKALEDPQQIISATIIPLSWTRVPCKMRSPSHGILKVAELALLYKVYIPFLMLGQQIAINIATNWTVSTDDANAFAENWEKFCLSSKHLFPKQKSKPNHHFSDHIPELFQQWGPPQASATWGYERLIGVFAKIPKNNKICMSDNKINIFTFIKHIN